MTTSDVNPDRTVHGYTPDGDPIVRYERAGKWFIEPAGGARKPVSLGEAARLAHAGRHLPHRAGGTRFDAAVGKLRHG